MSKQYSGGFITKSFQAPSEISASGIWTLDQAEYYTQKGTWPTPQTYWFSSYATGNNSFGGGIAVSNTNRISTVNRNFNRGIVVLDKAGTIEGNKDLGPPTGNNYDTCSAFDDNGNYYLIAKRNTNGYGYGIRIGKYDSSNNLIWQRYLAGYSNGDGGGQIPFAAKIFGSSLYIVGKSGGFQGDESTDSGWCFLVKYDLNGNLVWQRGLNAGWDVGQPAWFRGLCIDASENIYCVGFHTRNSDGWHNGVIAKYNSSGTLLWQRTLGAGCMFFCCDCDSSGNVYVGGRAISDVNYDQNSYRFIAKYNSSGVLQWQKYEYVGSSPGYQYVQGIKYITDSQIYFVSYTSQVLYTTSVGARPVGFDVSNTSQFSITSKGNNIYLSGTYNTSAPYKLFIAKFPLAGITSGTYTASGGTSITFAGAASDSRWYDTGYTDSASGLGNFADTVLNNTSTFSNNGLGWSQDKATV